MKGSFGMKGRRVISQGVGNVSVDEDEYTTAVITGLAKELRKHGVRVLTEEEFLELVER